MPPRLLRLVGRLVGRVQLRRWREVGQARRRRRSLSGRRCGGLVRRRLGRRLGPRLERRSGEGGRVARRARLATGRLLGLLGRPPRPVGGVPLLLLRV